MSMDMNKMMKQVQQMQEQMAKAQEELSNETVEGTAGGGMVRVRATGGLQDTIVDASEPGGNGFKFSDYSPGALVAAVRRAVEAFADKPAWEGLQRTGMARNSSWDVSARDYVKVYREVINGIR